MGNDKLIAHLSSSAKMVTWHCLEPLITLCVFLYEKKISAIHLISREPHYLVVGK